MSFQNTFDQKRVRRIERRNRKGQTASLWKKLGLFVGYFTTRRNVKGHDYRAFHNLPHSSHAAKLAAGLRTKFEEVPNPLAR